MRPHIQNRDKRRPPLKVCRDNGCDSQKRDVGYPIENRTWIKIPKGIKCTENSFIIVL